MILKNGNDTTQRRIEDFEMLVAKVFAVSEEAGYKLVRMAEEGEAILNCHKWLQCLFRWDHTTEGHCYWSNISDQVDN